MCCAGNDFILQFFAQVAEVIAVASYAYDQAAVLFGVILCSAQSIRIYHGELDVMSIQVEMAAHQMDEAVHAIFAIQYLRSELLVEQRANCRDD